MKILLDTSVCVQLLRRNAYTMESLMAYKARDVAIPAHAVAELDHGVHLAQHRKDSRRQVDMLLSRYHVHAFDAAVARRAGLLMFETGRHGYTMKFFDLMIAAHAIETGLTLATADADFEPLSGARGLKLAKWM